MTCACCETGRCCQGANCTAGGTHSQCASIDGTFTGGGDCASYTCIPNLPSHGACDLRNECACIAAGRTPYTGFATCNCNTLTAGGVPDGGCNVSACQVCNSATGNCASFCPSPRECCFGTCCAESELCRSGSCSPKCSSGTTYCNTGNASFYNFACCTSTQKCCGSDGCQSYTDLGSGGVNLQSDKDPTNGGDGWYDTGLTISSGVSLTISARGDSSDGTFPDGSTTGVTVEGLAPGASPNTGNRFSTSYNYMALLGKVGSTVFLVGSSYSGSPGTGRFYLRMNRGTYISGASVGGPIAITFSRRSDPCPGYTPAAIGEPIVHAAELPTPGPGAALKSILSLAGITSSPTCSCNARAAQMDAWGEWGSLTRTPEIVGWLQQEADKRGMWFCRTAGYALVLAAVFLSALKRLVRGNNK